MARVIVTETYLEDIADAIRSVNGEETTYKPSEMAAVIDDFYIEPTGTKSITANGTGIDVKDYASADVNVPNTYTTEDEGKVVDEGELVAQGSQTITQNGTYDTTLIAELIANIEGGGGGGDDWTTLKTYIESSGTQYIDTGYLPTDNTSVEIVASASRGSNQYPTIFGMRPQAYSASGTHDFLIHIYSQNERQTLFQRNKQVAVVDYTKLVDKKTKYRFGADWYSVENASYMLGESVQSLGSITGTYSLYIFNFNNMGASFGSNAACIMKLYRFRIYEGDALVHEFVPWKDGNDVVCLKDTVTGDLKYNAGTGVFTYGTDA